MQEIHPADVEMLSALIPMAVSVVLLFLSIHFGLWDKFILAVGQFDLHGVMGLVME